MLWGKSRESIPIAVGSYWSNVQYDFSEDAQIAKRQKQGGKEICPNFTIGECTLHRRKRKGRDLAAFRL